jgi:hypothetical protein
VLRDDLVPEPPVKRKKQRSTGREGFAGKNPRAKAESGKRRSDGKAILSETKEAGETTSSVQPTSQTKPQEEKE